MKTPEQLDLLVWAEARSLRAVKLSQAERPRTQPNLLPRGRQ